MASVRRRRLRRMTIPDRMATLGLWHIHPGSAALRARLVDVGASAPWRRAPVSRENDDAALDSAF